MDDPSAEAPPPEVPTLGSSCAVGCGFIAVVLGLILGAVLFTLFMIGLVST